MWVILDDCRYAGDRRVEVFVVHFFRKVDQESLRVAVWAPLHLSGAHRDEGAGCDEGLAGAASEGECQYQSKMFHFLKKKSGA